MFEGAQFYGSCVSMFPAALQRIADAMPDRDIHAEFQADLDRVEEEMDRDVAAEAERDVNDAF